MIFHIHNTFFIHSDVLIYSAFVVDVATIVCFLNDQHIAEFPINIMYPGIDFLLYESPAKSEFEYAFI